MKKRGNIIRKELAVNRQLSTVNRSLSTVNCSPSTVNRQPFTVYRQLFTVLLFFFLLSIVSAIPQTFNIHGKLTSSDGTPVTSVTNINFSIYNAYTGGTPIYTKVKSITPDSEGIYDVILDGIDNIKVDTQYFLGIKVGSDAEMTPRINLTSTPYAIRAQNITVSGVEFNSQVNLSGQNLITTGNITASYFIGDGSKLTNLNLSGIEGASQWITSGNNIYFNVGNVGIGLTSPTYKLAVAGNVSIGGNLTMNNNKITGLANGTATTDAVTLSQLQAVNSTITGDFVPYSGATKNLTLGTFNISGNLGSFNKLRIANNEWISGVDSSGTGLVNMFKVNPNNEIDVGGTLNIGTLSFSEDSGLVTAMDMPVSSLASVGTPEGYVFRVDSDNILSVYSESDGSGGVQNKRVGIGTISPTSTLDVNGTANIRGTLTMNSNKITGLANGTTATEAVTYSQLQAVNTSATAVETDPKWTGNWTNVAFINKANTFAENNIFSKNLTVDTNTLFVNSNTDRVGIGTITPTAKLQVAGNVSIGGNLTMNSNKIINLLNGTDPTDAVTKSQLDAVSNTVSGDFVPYTGATKNISLGSQTLTTTGAVSVGALNATTLNTGQGANKLYAMNQNVTNVSSPKFAGLNITGNIVMNNNKITNLSNGSSNYDAVTKIQLDAISSAVSGDLSNYYLKSNPFGYYNSTTDGSGTGLDADLLDGKNSSDFANVSDSLYYVEGTGTTAGTWLGTNPDIKSYYNGLTIAYKIGIAGASTTNLKINDLDAIQVYRNTDALTTHLPVNTVVILTYTNVSGVGRWVWADYNVDNTESYTVRWTGPGVIAGEQITRYKLLMMAPDGRYHPIVIGDSTSANAKTINSQPFVVNSPILAYYTTATVAANTATATTSIHSAVSMSTNFRYNQNVQSGWVAHKPIYLKGIINNNGLFVLAGNGTTGGDYLTQNLPTTDDGYVYIMLGMMYTDTTSFRLNTEHPIFEFKNGKLRMYTNQDLSDFVPYIGATRLVNLSGQTLTTTGNIVGNINASNITSGTLAVARGGTGATTFTAGRILFGAGTSAINTNSDLFWDNTNKRLGIGTAVPQQKLHVNGSAVFNGTINMGGNKIINLSNGSSPTDAVTKAQLDAVNSTVSGDLSNYYLKSNPFGYYNSTTLPSVTETDPKWTSNWTNVAFINKANSFGAFNQSFNTNTLFIDATNKQVGIGTSMPASSLHVMGKTGSTTVLTLTSFVENGTSNQNAKITYSGSGTNSLDISTGYDSNTNKITLSPKGTTAMTLLGSGNVGIGTGNPDKLLNIQGSHITSQIHLKAENNAYTNSDLYLWASEPGLTYMGTGISNNWRYTGSWGRENTSIGASYIRLLDGSMTFNLVNSTGTDTRIITLGSNGNVGIGTATPTSKLSVAGNVSIGGNLTMNDNIITGLKNGSSDTDAVTLSQLKAVNSSSLKTETDPKWTSNWTNVAFKNAANTFTGNNVFNKNLTVDTNTLFINSDTDRVGIGTLTPTAKLQVLGNVSIGGNLTLGTFNISGNLGSFNKLRIANNEWISAVDSSGTGLVNMFKVNPNNEIDVGGTLNIGTLSFSEDSGLVTAMDMPVSSLASVGTPEGYVFRVDSDNILSVYSESDGSGGVQNKRVGIGTISPTSTLDVNGTANIGGNLTITGNNLYGSGGANFFETSSYAASKTVSGISSSGTISYANIAIGASQVTSGTLAVARGGTGATTFTAGRILFGAGTSAINTSSDLFWDNTNKRLGIGTAVPQQKFHVNGTNGGLLIDVDNAGTNHPVINTTLGNVTISSAGGSVIIKLG